MVGECIPDWLLDAPNALSLSLSIKSSEQRRIFQQPATGGGFGLQLEGERILAHESNLKT
ncbi:hypothetical protein Taro_029164 [Colocasia esculenta]|uniref:Uncharacterized protein n=1 Tax=Colocasia esculenta TaxID=4460 RepID=A0A843VKH8_COLES|nr:hypothetical protein [Colocasia esculenta]